LLLNLVVLNAGIAGGVVEGFSRAAVVGDVVIADGAGRPGWLGTVGRPVGLPAGGIPSEICALGADGG